MAYMKIILKNLSHLILLISLLITVNSCIDKNIEKEETVKQKSIEYLNNKYKKEFEIDTFKQFFHGGIWKYETDLMAHPVDNKTLHFWLKYDAKNRKVESDNYKKVYWEDQIKKEVRPILEDRFTVLELDARLTKNGSIIFNNSDMEFYPEYGKMLENIDLPVLHLDIHIKGIPTPQDERLDVFAKLCDTLAKKAFVKNSFIVYFYDESITKEKYDQLNYIGSPDDTSLCKKELSFKFTNKQHTPQRKDIESLVIGLKKDSLYKYNKAIFEMAEKYRQESQTEKALELYLQIVSNVSDYRYNTYAPSEAAYSIESAFYAGEILEQQGNSEQATELFNSIVRKMEYEEVRLNLNDFYKKAKQKLESK